MENPAILLRRLNPYCARAMEGAAALCQTRAHADILPEHWLLKLLEQGEGDLTVLARRYEWDMDNIWQDLLGWLDTLPRSVRSRPQLAESTQTLMQDAWLRASLAGEEQIRSIHLLMALVDSPKLIRCDGLWPLLTLGQSQLPDKAVDLLDTASARVRMNLDTVPEPLTRLKSAITALETEKQALLEDVAVGNSMHGERLEAIDKEEVSIILQLDALETQYGQELALTEQLLACRTDISRQAEMADLQAQLRAVQQGNPLLGLDVDTRAVAEVIADWTGVPLSSLMKDEQTELLSLEAALEKRVVGQDAALSAFARRLRAAKTGLTPENGPQGVFLLVGPSGVGKTETALALADVLYGGEKSLITINLSEYQEPHTVSQLKGSPPGYVGYGQGGILTEAVRKRPYSVVLLDEVEKAHRDVMNLFYQVFDRGFMRDGEGREIDFRNTVILMTANLGSDRIMQRLDEQPDATDASLHELLRPILRDHFQPALLARFQTVIYRPLGQQAMRTIVEMKLEQVSQRLARHYGMTTHIGESLYDALTAACLLPDTGARNVDSLLSQQILPVLSQQLLSHMAAKQKPHALTLGWSEEAGISMEFKHD